MDENTVVSYGVPISLLIERDLQIESSQSILACNSDVLRRIEDDAERLIYNCISDISSSLQEGFTGCAYL